MSPRSDDDATPVAHVAVRVTRTGGIAGMRREWRAEAPVDDAPQWIALIQSCPWDAPGVASAPVGGDRFVWSIDARCGADERAARLDDHDVNGPWRELVDAVRDTAGRP